MKQQNFKNFPLLILGMCLVLASSCKKDIPVLTTTAVTEITQNTAMSGGDITSEGGTAVTARGVCWSTGQTPTISDSKTTDGTGTGEFSSSLSDLSPNTTYYVRAYATNSTGTAYGNAISFKTKGGGSDGTFTDLRDGNIYKTVTIGTQVWMAENLRYLPSVVSLEIGSKTTPLYYVHGYIGDNVAEAKATANYTTYGVLYNWPAACSSCPPGWHLPSDSEWTVLIEYLGGEEVAGGKLKDTGTIHWNSPNIGATNETGFTALPGSDRLQIGNFGILGRFGYWWTATVGNAIITAWGMSIDYNKTIVGRVSYDKERGHSVRCVKD